LSVSIRKISNALGAEVVGVNLSTSVDEHLIETIKSALHEHLLLVIRDQNLMPAAQVEFSKRFGNLVVRVSGEFLHPQHNEVLILSNRIENGKRQGASEAYAGSHWHSDLTYAECPSMGSMLHAIEVAENGGDTTWGNMYMAYDKLPEKTKGRIRGLKAIHVRDRRRNPRAGLTGDFDSDVEQYYSIKVSDSVHPVVRTHPVTKRKSLFVSPRFTVAIDGMDDTMGQPLLDELFQHQKKPQFLYQHKWRIGDLVFWDNRCTIHIACGGIVPPGIRHLHRTSIAGDAPF